MISLLTGKALLWARAIWNANSAITNSYDAFTNHFKEVFGSATGLLSVSDQLLQLRQGSSTTSDYTLQFRTLAATSGWNEAALHCAYRQGLDPRICAQKTTRISQWLSACQPDEAAHQPASFTSGSPVPEPMQLDSTRLTHAERARRLTAGLCLYCAAPGHFINPCPVRPPHPAVSTLQLEPEIATLSLLPVQILTPGCSVSVSALVDCLIEVPKPPTRPIRAQVASTLVERPEPQEIPIVPSDYAAFQDVFSKQAATRLLPHRPWDCAIDLLPGAKLPKGRVYPLSIPECKTMEDYIQEALKQGFIQPSTSPVASSFFFVGKKDGGLWPCIDYRMLNRRHSSLPQATMNFRSCRMPFLTHHPSSKAL